MTGETDPLHKNTYQYCLKKKREIEASGEKNNSEKHEIPSPILLSGTKILSGEGRMMILVVGDQSCIGKIRALLSQD
jgi:magnesium-transporting ATPase (P-type)